MKTYFSSSNKETKEIAENIAKNLGSISIIGLSGELGSGKTVFAQGFAKALGVKDKIISPTFVLIRQHKIPNSKKTLYHIDLYRIDSVNQIKMIGIEEIMTDTENIVLIEWAEKIKNLLPKKAMQISIEIVDKNSRKITISS